MLKYTLYTLINSELISPVTLLCSLIIPYPELHFCSVPRLNSSEFLSLLFHPYPCDESVPLSHCRPFQASHTSLLRPAGSLCHPPVGIEIPHNCYSSTCQMYWGAHKQKPHKCLYGKLIRCNTLTNGQDQACPK